MRIGLSALQDLEPLSKIANTPVDYTTSATAGIALRKAARQNT